MKHAVTIKVQHDRHGKPLAEVQDLPGLYAEMYGADRRALATALNEAADLLDSPAARTGLTRTWTWKNGTDGQ